MTAIRSIVFIPIAALLLVAPPEAAAQVEVEGNMVETKASSACALLVAPGSQKYIDCTNGTVYDTEAGIFWLKDADCIFGASRRSWGSAMLVTRGLSHGQDCDFDGSPDLTDGSQDGDWRLPTYREWLNRVFQPAMSGCLPALFNDPGTGCLADGPSAFVNVVEDDAYWSSSTISFDPTKAYAASLSPGDVDSVGKSSALAVWPVRDALPHELPFLAQVDGLPMETRADRCLPDAATYDQRYIDCGDGTVLDTVTDLLWLQDATCAQLPFLAGGEGDWIDAMRSVARLADGLCGLTDGSQAGDWRLPTQGEFEWSSERAVDLGCTDAGANDPPALTDTEGTGCLNEGTTPFLGVLDALPNLRFWMRRTVYSSVKGSFADAAVFRLTLGISALLQDKTTTTGIYAWPVRPRKEGI